MRNMQYILFLVKADNLSVGDMSTKRVQSATTFVSGIEIILPLAGLIDLDKEKQRLEKEIAGAREEAARCQAKLSNENFVQRAPAKEVDKVRERLQDAQAKVEGLVEKLQLLG